MYVPVFHKTYRTLDELPKTDPRLLGAFLSLCVNFSALHFGKQLLITCINRTKEENIEVGGKELSGHLAKPVRAIDLRVKAIRSYPGLLPVERKWVVTYWTKHFAGLGAYAVDEGDHIHLQMSTVEV